MAPLNPHWEAVTDKTQQILATLGGLESVRSFYLAGGTALALQLGHRISQDLDLFANVESLTESWRRALASSLQEKHSVAILQTSPMGLVLEVDGLAVGFFTYGYSLLDTMQVVTGILIAGLTDIGLMKLDAIAGRGLRKDFYDVYFVAKQIPLSVLFDASLKKYPSTRGYRMRVLKALTDFEIAEREPDPILLASASWDQVKAFFVDQARGLGNAWFGQSGEKI